MLIFEINANMNIVRFDKHDTQDSKWGIIIKNIKSAVENMINKRIEL
jgi:hypothetical protein